jgi:hypothetical protein
MLDIKEIITFQRKFGIRINLSLILLIYRRFRPLFFVLVVLVIYHNKCIFFFPFSVINFNIKFNLKFIYKYKNNH